MLKATDLTTSHDGAPIHGGDAAAALLDALNRARRDIPTFFIKLPGMIRSMRNAG